MCPAPGNDVSHRYIEDNLPVGFFTNPPPDAKAVFSTANGKKDFRRMTHILPRRKLHLWAKNEIQSACNSLRQAYWDVMRTMAQPLCWDDLWHYFDAFDLYNCGAINLWNVINHLVAENKIIYADWMKECAVQIGRWAGDWVEKPGNTQKLRAWDMSRGPVVQILNEEDWVSLGSLTDETIPILSNALKYRREHLLAPGKHGAAEPRALLSSARSAEGLENWMSKLIHWRYYAIIC